jgi:putative FmdB family regulatory protein
MPIYEYACTACGHRFEELQEMNAAPVDRCPKCGKTVKKLMSTAVPMGSKGHCADKPCCGNGDQCGNLPMCHGGHCHG